MYTVSFGLLGICQGQDLNFVFSRPGVGKVEDKFNQFPAGATPGGNEHRFIKELLAGDND